MSVETETDLSRQTARETMADWAPKARRHGEKPGWAELPRLDNEIDGGPVFPSMSPPPVWPRVFPGI